MKIELRIPTEEQFAFIDLILDSGEELTDTMIDTAITDYRRVTGQIKATEGLSRKEWNAVLDGLNMGLTMEAETFEKMSPKQREFYHEQEKSIARLKGKESQEIHV